MSFSSDSYEVEGLTDRFQYNFSPSPDPSTASLPWSTRAVVGGGSNHQWPNSPPILRSNGNQQGPSLHTQMSRFMNAPPNINQTADDNHDSDSSDSGSETTLESFDDLEAASPSSPPSPSSSSSSTMGSSASQPVNNTNSEPIDLTGSPSPPPAPIEHPPHPLTSPSTSRKRTRAQASLSTTSDSDEPPTDSRNKRRRRNNPPSQTNSRSALAVSVPAPAERSTINPPLGPPRRHQPTNPAAPRTIEQIDLCNDDDPISKEAEIQKTLQKQRAEQITIQNAIDPTLSNTPSGTSRSGNTKLTQLQCTVCLESPTDLTATACGHTFCRACLLDWLVSSEREQGRRANCPACRKPLSWRDTKKKDVVTLCFMKREVGAAA